MLESNVTPNPYRADDWNTIQYTLNYECAYQKVIDHVDCSTI